MENNNPTYSEVRIEFFDESREGYCIDAWKSDDSNEEGTVLGVVFEDGSVEWYVTSARCCPEVISAIKEFRPASKVELLSTEQYCNLVDLCVATETLRKACVKAQKFLTDNKLEKLCSDLSLDDIKDMEDLLFSISNIHKFEGIG